jgi:plastocyanin
MPAMRVLASTHHVRRIQARALRALLLVALLLPHAPGCSAIRKPAPWLAPAQPTTPTGGVTGELVIPEAAAATSEPVVVYLEPQETAKASSAARIATVTQHRGTLQPEFLAVARGDAVRFLNEDEVYQQIFSASEPNHFDTGLLRRGESSVVRMRRPGVVRLYSALDETTAGVVYVSPSPYFAVVYPPARFEIRDVPAGRYQLHTWCETGRPLSRELDIPPGAPTLLEIRDEELWQTP